MRQGRNVVKWIKSFDAVDPVREVQMLVGEIYAQFSDGSARRDGANRFVIAEAKHREMTVVTYEGRSFSGVPTTRWERSMPGICQRFEVPCAALPEALAMLGASF